MDSQQFQLGIYQHHKGNLYKVIGIAKHTETLEELVIYHPLNEQHDLKARPKSMFYENVTIDGKEMPRFKYINEK